MKVLGVIPARYESERFPGKVLAKIGNKTMIRRVYERAHECKIIDKLVVGVDDERIREEVASFGGEALMTSTEHSTGTDRIVEVAEFYTDYDIIVNIQGDEPGIDPALIHGVVELKKHNPEYAVTTGARPFHPNEDPLDPNRVKVALSHKNRALYFSRSLIPFPRNKIEHPIHLHLGIYAYDREFLLHFNTLPYSSLEKTESLEQLRALENDYAIGVHLVQDALPGVDTPEDLKRIVSLFKSHGLL